ncbi:acetyltransferase [Nitrosospira sp. Nsp14]|uniref:bifunctional acetate--CoA ligase family protein/GNAT family N-acetyltransferase n=1 Tax=Nitrosospira sp. Nsp14 TaxID=1855333 RepID=UPI0008EB2C08|nr:bifunctional acetate--CoA ligase family protein/GNAT family N-acetyltransferase [Nitrosospira sp. Nsp14]SFH57168.1 acetyltransferase [Nitrosospira sp. Nsp14]
MSQHYLSPLFTPKSVAVFGASNSPASVGQVVFENMLKSGFQGSLYPINPKYAEVQGKRAYSSINEVHEPVELAVIATPAQTVPPIIENCGAAGVKAAVIITAGFHEAGARLEEQLLATARAYGIRLLGPNCLGIMRPSIGLNATFYKGGAGNGNIAFVSQSGALCTAILDWAQNNDVGFSSIVSMGSSIDVDFGEILDYLVADPGTQSILMYIEGIHDARRFMSALRAAARLKPVILVKVGRHAAGAKAALSHTAALVGADNIFNAAVNRVGAVRVQTITQLFTAAKALSLNFCRFGSRLAIVTNGGGPGVMAADRAADVGLSLAALADNTLQYLDQYLPAHWSRGNPIDIIGDAGADRYRHAVKACLEDENVDGVLAIFTPQAMSQPLESAQALITLAAGNCKPLLACWMGEAQVAEAREAFAKARIPHFRTPEPAIEVFSHLSAYYRNQQLLRQMPGRISHHLEPDVEGARMIIEGALQEHRNVLTAMESKAVLAAFHVPVAQTMIARSPGEALLIAEQLKFPVAMKVNSHDITHKTDVGGVLLNLKNAHEVRAAYQDILDAVREKRPEGHMDGVSIEPMILKPNGRELMVGVTSDPVFGPVITFGSGGTEVEVKSTPAIALPPLNKFLTRELIQEANITKLLGPFRQMPPANLEALEDVFLRVSEMVCELPWLKEMDVNPLILDETGALAADARIIVEFRQPSPDRYAHMAIAPYPTHLVSHWQFADGMDITIRPIRPEDAELDQRFIRGLSDESRYFRFMEAIHELPQTLLASLTQIDYGCEMALVALTPDKDRDQDRETALGVARYVINPDGNSCNFALAVADNVRGKGLGRKLMTSLMEAARAQGLKEIEGLVLSNNDRMLGLMHRLGFSIKSAEDNHGLMKVSKPL